MTDNPNSVETPHRRRPRTPTGIPFGTVEALIAKLHGLEGDRTALKARLHHLRRLNFPDGVAAGSGRHFAYGAADVIGLTIVFELTDAFVPPVAAVAMVRAGWPEIARAAAQGRDASGPASFVSFHSAALRALGDGPGSRGALSEIHAELEDISGARDAGPVVSLDVASLLRRSLAGLRSIDPRSHAIMASEMETVAHRFGTGRPLARGEAEMGRLGGDGPYWSRAAALLARSPSTDHPRDTRRLRSLLDYILKPAPIDAWKTRVKVVPEVSFAEAMAWWCGTVGLIAARTTVPADRLQDTGTSLLASCGTATAVADRLREIVRQAQQLTAASPR